MSILDAFKRRPNFRKLSEKENRKKLERYLHHQDSYNRWRALVALMSISPAREYDLVLKEFISKDESRGLEHFSNFLGYQSKPGSRVIAIDGSPVNYGLETSERCTVVRALAFFETPMMIPLFIHALGDSEGWVRGEAVLALKKISYKPSPVDKERLVRMLLAKLRLDPERFVRIYAAEAVGRFGDSVVLPELDAVVQDANQDPETRRKASRASDQIRNRRATRPSNTQ